MKWHIRLTQQYFGYMFRSKLDAIIRLIMTHTYAGAHQEGFCYLQCLDITHVPPQHVACYKARLSMQQYKMHFMTHFLLNLTYIF